MTELFSAVVSRPSPFNANPPRSDNRDRRSHASVLLAGCPYHKRQSRYIIVGPARRVRHGYAGWIAGRVMDSMERPSPTGHPSFVLRPTVPRRTGLTAAGTRCRPGSAETIYLPPVSSTVALAMVQPPSECL